ncbi:hypothetical protein [Anaeromyxobacter diazotrophicus]|uniref:Uncharacterized protein n=1 Tax=Anaeromyxobacter diazotrophicus TaxID=2590199 RepID=A0A7I9VKU0_9BACT|nr:hypothetical protein [Anaeromyxobacter diazotrophicus]GEJ57034.1 hypothetical protein AMYX_17750 [Anaeromyxobacter diazotrophicus]
MPVSKKRKKAGKPVQRQAPSSGAQASTEHPEGHPSHPVMKAGKPKNPFVAHQPAARSSQRGR